MKRSAPLRRRTPLRSRGKTSYRRRERDLDYMKLVRKLACIVGSSDNATTCEGRVEADHAGQRALGRKADDTTCIPCCRKHHRERTDMTGTFKHWTKEAMRAWCDVAIARTKGEIAEMMAVKIFVKPDGDDMGDGMTWATAYRTVPRALQYAEQHPGPRYIIEVKSIDL